MPPRRWVAFADDSGDPGAHGSSHFGYALLVLDSECIPEFVKARTEFRYQNRLWREAKGGNVNRPRFREAIESLEPVLDGGEAFVAACMITKEKYSGPWLNPIEQAPADPTFLRNYLVRKTLELAFDGLEDHSGDLLELVLDRVDYSDEQVLNLRRYLDADFTEFGPFKFPYVTHVTHGDSQYIEGLQVADHFARLAYGVARAVTSVESEHMARLWMRMETVVSGRSFTLAEDARNLILRRTLLREEQEEGGGRRPYTGHPPPPD